ncbi:DUF3053 domain-containing protein [Dickeya dadantii]|uniref:Conserved protein n=1 Tax=Dickeya dadantii (strain 3937) TaxID=198628 RepID=E0SN90_DICD3|nr:DUF3053 domain-containing protein [Dickeya dadantii]ADN00641.1 conserved protein [Dickeya dadantii 3937]MCA7011836.1 DUF3053 domain-containing protein [Dickeya dadantii]NAT77206.1 DUF3053 domain-containing protein [Dickeya dadantii]NPE53082.1 DUF3053 domain-containing protein [Dickeya dadantii]NPE56454.1 DUF3053 domain-containing protein [Dickeya dadantii]
MMLADYRSRWLLPVVMLVAALQLSACGDKDKDARQAFITFLQGISQQEGRQLPALSEQQKQSFGRFTQDYAVMTAFNQQLDQALAGSLTPMLDVVSRIRVPQDYVTQRDNLRQALGGLNMLSPQVQNAKTQADNAHRALKQPEELQTVYDKVYNRAVSLPANAMVTVVPASTSFAQSVVQVGDYLQTQGNQVVFGNNGVQFHTQQQVDQYNSMMTDIANQQQKLFTTLKSQNFLPH